jgi:hypothetical protein
LGNKPCYPKFLWGEERTPSGEERAPKRAMCQPGRMQFYGGKSIIVGVHSPFFPCSPLTHTQTEHSRNHFPPSLTSATSETCKPMKLTHFSCEAQHDCTVPEPYRTLAILLLLPMFSLDWCGLYRS